MISLSIPSWLSSNIAELRNKTETQTHVQHTHPQTAAMLVQENTAVEVDCWYLSHAFVCPSWTLAIP